MPLPQQEPVSQQQWGSGHQAGSVAQAQQVQAYGPSWQQLCVLRQRRCRLRSHGSVAAAAFLKQRAAATASSSDASGVSAAGEFVQLYGASRPVGDVDVPARTAAGVRKCVALRDYHGNLVPLPASCTAGVCTSKASSSSNSVASMCVAGIGCDHAALAAEAKQARIAARQPAAYWGSGGRKRALWTLDWLWGTRTRTPAATPAAAAADNAEAVPDRAAAPGAAEGGAWQGLAGAALDTSSSSSSAYDPRTRVVTVGWDVAAAAADDDCQDELPGLTWSTQVSYPGAAAADSHSEQPAADAPAGSPREPGAALDSTSSSDYSSDYRSASSSRCGSYSPPRYSPPSYCPPSPSAYSESEMSEDDACSSDDDQDAYEYSYSDSDDESSDDEGVSLVDARAAELHANRAVFRNERDVIYGFWRACPLG